MIYKTVAGPKQTLSVDAEGAAPSFSEFETVLNKYAAEGWKYHSMELVCARFVHPKKLVPTGSAENYYMMIFYKD